MPTLIVPANAMARQVDDFPSTCKRSCEGALYVRPASTLVSTDDEWEHIQKKHPHIADQLIVVQKSRVRSRHQLEASRAAKKAKLGDS